MPGLITATSPRCSTRRAIGGTSSWSDGRHPLRGRSRFGEAEARVSIELETVIPGREQSERTRNPEQCMVLDSGSAPKRAHPGMTRSLLLHAERDEAQFALGVGDQQ